MREALQQTDKVSYYNFLKSLAKDETINQAIGRFIITLQLLLQHPKCHYSYILDSGQLHNLCTQFALQ